MKNLKTLAFFAVVLMMAVAIMLPAFAGAERPDVIGSWSNSEESSLRARITFLDDTHCITESYIISGSSAMKLGEHQCVYKWTDDSVISVMHDGKEFTYTYRDGKLYNSIDEYTKEGGSAPGAEGSASVESSKPIIEKEIVSKALSNMGVTQSKVSSIAFCRFDDRKEIEKQLSKSSFEYPKSGYVFVVWTKDKDSIVIVSTESGRVVYSGSCNYWLDRSGRLSSQGQYDKASAAGSEAVFISGAALAASMGTALSGTSSISISIGGSAALEWESLSLN